MALLSVAAMNASLDNDYGTTAGPNAAAHHLLALWVGDPADEDSYELAGAGYARVQVNPADWAPAVDGAKTTTEPVQFPPPTDEWDEPSHWVLYAPDGVTAWDYAELVEPLLVTEASATGPEVTPTVYYTDSLLEEG